MDTLQIQVFVGLLSIALGLPATFAETPSGARKPFSSFVQVIFGIVLILLAFMRLSIVR